MATPSHAQAVKSLNKSPGRRRFVFKSFYQRIEDIDIDVYRSLDKIKSEPSEGSSFFLDCLVEWRELNTAEDFISFYLKMMPLVQTLPLILLQKELIISELLSRLQMKARLSVEPILRLIAALSRDLLEDFIAFLPRIADSYTYLLKSGADREPEIIEQVFTSWSHILMYLQKYLIKDVEHVLKVTAKLRYYPKAYIQEFMASATSFLLRNAPTEQLRKGIRKVMFEVVKEPLPVRKSAVAALLYHVMKGPSSRFHSRADRVIQLLTEKSIFTRDAGSVTDVVTATFERFCEDMEPKELKLIWDCLCHKIENYLNDDYQHLSCLLSVLVSTVRVNNGMEVSDMIKLVGSIIDKLMVPSSIPLTEDGLKVIDKVLDLMLCILDVLKNSDMSAISDCSKDWGKVFALKSNGCSTFMRELLGKDLCILSAFRAHILSAINDLIEVSEDEAMDLLFCLCQRLQENSLNSSFFDGASKEGLSKIRGFLQGAICSLNAVVNAVTLGNPAIEKNKLALFWGALYCYPHVLDIQADPTSLRGLIDSFDQLLMVEVGNIAGVPKSTWQSLAAASLSSYYKCDKISGIKETSKMLHLAKICKSSFHVLTAVADYLDYVHGPILEADDRHRSCLPEFTGKNALDALVTFADNLCNSEKEIRVSTLRILCHYCCRECEIPAVDDQPSQKRLKTEAPQINHANRHGIDVLQLLLSIEATPLSISTSRKVILLISKIHMAVSTGRISETYLPIILSGMIGVLHNRFSYLWNPASECIAVLVGENVALLWDRFICYFTECFSRFRSSHDRSDEGSSQSPNKGGLVERFNSFVVATSDCTPYATVLSSLLQSLQKIPSVAESRSRQLVPLFLTFLGYSDDRLCVGSFNSDACKGKDWKGVLKEWLNLFKLMQNPKAFYRSQFLKDVMLIRLMDDNDAEVQMRVLDCLLNWKDEFLLPYEQHVRNLVSLKCLREELTTWSLSKESDLIEEGHRGSLVPLILRILIPKVRKPKTLASRKHTSVQHRKAVLRFIAELDAAEIAIFFVLLMKPLHIISEEANASVFWSSSWSFNDALQPLNLVNYFTTENIMALSWKKRYGFLHVIEDIFGVFGESHIKPYLDLLVGCTVRILGCCTTSLETAKGTGSSLGEMDLHKDGTIVGNDSLSITALKQLKDLRSLCLKIISLILNKYDDHDFGCEFWDTFFTSVKPLVNSFKQEGSSSEKPSSLFSCFLAMSSSYNLVSLLSKEKQIVPAIFSILTVDTASEAIRSCVLKFTENLLNLDEELGGKDNVAQAIILENLDELISSLHHCFQGDGARRFKCHGEVQTRIFKLLSKYVHDRPLSKKFVDLLLPLLSKRSEDSEVYVGYLQIIQNVVPALGNECSSEILNAVCPLLISVELPVRSSICELLDALEKIDPSVSCVAKLLCELNATSALEMGDLDYDSIINAYAKIDVDFFLSFQESHAMLILSQCVHDMSSDEIIMRQSAYRSLLSFIEFCTRVLGGEVSETDSNWTKACVHRMINKFLLKHMGNAVKAGNSIRKEWIELLRDMVLKLPEFENLKSLRALCSEDAEQDFFNNIIHLQKHRRAKALSRFNNVVSNNAVAEGILNKVFIPLFFNLLFDLHSGKADHVKTACIEALASVAARMEWNSYYSLLMRCFQEIKMNPDKHKLLVRLICSLLDQFHFSQSCSGQANTDSLESIAGTGENKATSLLTLQRCNAGASALLLKNNDCVIAPDVLSRLHKTVLPKMQKLLDCDRDKINVNINVAILKLLKLLPGDVLDSQLPTIIHRIANHLKNRMESIRDEARLALAACLKELGLGYMQFVLGVLRATLKRGYELHVLGYSLNFILSKFSSVSICGELDYCLEDLLSVVENDILGDVAEEKEVEKIASKMKETRKLKSFETLKIIAQSVTFRSDGLKLLSPVKNCMQKHLTPKLKTKLESMLSHIAAGIECNPSVDQNDLLIFIYDFIQDFINEENGQSEDPCMESVPTSKHASGSNKFPPGKVIRSKSGSSHLIPVFALGLLNKRMKNMKLDKDDISLLEMLDPFVKLLGDCLGSRYEDVLSASLRCLTPLVRLPLPSLASQADKLKVTLLSIAQSSVNANNPLMQSCLKMLTVLLRSTKMTLSSEQLHMLIQFPVFVDLERNPSFVALSLLKAIVKRKLIVPEIYELMVRLSEIMVTSQVDPIRKKCSKVLLQFLLNYDLAAKYVQQQIDFLLQNLSYEHSTGREAALEMLHAIIIKSSQNSLEKHANALFIRLVLCLVNDSDRKVRSMAGTVIKLLIERVSSHLKDSLLDFSISWYIDEKRRLQSTGAQAIGLLVEVMNKNFKNHIRTILPASKNILQLAANVTNKMSVDPSDEASPPWKEAYYSLVLWEKILHHVHDLIFQQDLEDIWRSVCDLLLHPHPWLRNISSRLVAFYFASVSKAEGQHKDKMFKHLLMRPERLFTIAVFLCFQLRTQVANDTSENFIAQNLVFCICTMHSLMGKDKYANPSVFWSTLEQHEQGLFIRAFQLLDSGKGKDKFFSVISGVHDEDDGHISENFLHFLISNLVKKMGKMSLHLDAKQTKIIFSSFGNISTKLNCEELLPYAVDMLVPLYKVCEGFAGKVIEDDVKQVAQEVSESIRNTLGIQNYVKMYSEIRKRMKEKREKRKQEQKVMAVVNPMRNAKRKLKIAEKHKAHKKRKIMTMKMGRWMR